MYETTVRPASVDQETTTFLLSEVHSRNRAHQPHTHPVISEVGPRAWKTRIYALIPTRGIVTARYGLGLMFLMLTVLMWTASSFLASGIFADGSYSKPFFVTYINAAAFAISFVPAYVVHRVRHPEHSDGLGPKEIRQSSMSFDPDQAQADRITLLNTALGSDHASAVESDDDRITPKFPDTSPPTHPHQSIQSNSDMTTCRQTLRLSLEFSGLWFLANYFAAACLQYTTVGSSTILTSTSSIWTLLIGAFARVETFTISKLIGVLGSLAGVILISSVDMTRSEERGSFPHKSHGQIAVGDLLALVSALMYGIYTIVMKRKIGDESRVSMPLFFGGIGILNLLLLWPGFLILHWSSIETFQLPMDGKTWVVILVNTATSFVSDLCWGYAMFLTSPLVATMGLSLTIPLSLVMQIILEGYNASPAYWIGAAVVFFTFGMVNWESVKEPAISIDSHDSSPDDQ